jgi:DNA-binding winged helix-turn-helix (wHTH) protein
LDIDVQFLFGDHTLDTDRRELRRGSEPIAVEPQVFDLLVYLVQNRDRVVSKDDLIASVWGGRIVSDSTLTSRINAARKAVGDSGEDQKLIRTIARKGLRFVGAVRHATKRRRTGHMPPRRMKCTSRRARPCRCPTGPPSPCFPSST